MPSGDDQAGPWTETGCVGAFVRSSEAIETEVGLSPGAYLVAPGRETSNLGHEELTRTLREAMRRAQMVGNRTAIGAESDEALQPTYGA